MPKPNPNNNIVLSSEDELEGIDEHSGNQVSEHPRTL